jgi:class 3 adenylate cyclase
MGLQRARAYQPALIVSDYDMPEMNGFEMVLALKRDPLTRETPVIMLTARDTRRDVAQMRAAGATAYLVKPFGQDKCIATVERTLAERRLYAYKEASRAYISEGAAKAAEARARSGDLGPARAEEREMSILFSDICGFTQMSAKLNPREVIDLLNDYFDQLCPLVKEEGGDIDKFIGDAIMAVFAELPGREPPPVRAVRAGLAMQQALAAWNLGRAAPVNMRIGVNTGTVVRGDIGPQFRREFAVIGDTVNRANRYEAGCPPGQLLVSQTTRDALGDRVECIAMPGLILKGVDNPVIAYVVKELRP